MNDHLQGWMLEATRLTQAGRLSEATRAIQRALGGAAAATGTAATAPVSDLVLEGCVFEVDAPPAPAPVAEPPKPPPRAARAESQTGAGEFQSGVATYASLTRSYKLYVPPAAAHCDRPLPLVVMLHGCTQDPDDFAAGTAMNEHACEQGFFVLYPAQSQDANPQRCWNWFKHNHQLRGSGEPAVIAGMTQATMKAHAIDPRRVYIAGLSAGGAMAAIVAAAYPDLFAAVGVHSGLAQGAAGDLSQALAAMRSGAAIPGQKARPGRLGKAPAAAPPRRHVPTIVFHGDADRTVHPRNGEQVLASAVAGAAGQPRVEQGVSAGGRRYTRSSHGGEGSPSVAEHWLLHGAGHAWSGGSAQGSFTDANGPDASREMLRFFFEHPLAPST